MAAGAEAPTSSEYIVHHLQHLQSIKQGFIIDMSVVNWDTIFWSIALGVLTAIRESGLSCPEDISVFGFDNQEFAELTNPSLSSVHQPGYQMGATAARLLLDRVSGDVQSPRHIVLETELKIRESVAPPREPEPKGTARKTGKRVRAGSRR